LSFLLVYDFGRYLIHQRAVELLNSRIYTGGPPLRAGAFPVGVANPFQWSGWIERPELAMHFSINLLADFDPSGGQVFYQPEPSPALDAARQSPVIRKF